MKRAGGMWNSVVAFENLHEAARRSALGKRRRIDVATFLMNQEVELIRLQNELVSGEYVTGRYREFLIQEPKERMISAAPFRDRVVHHALTQILEPVFEKRFSKDSFACRTGYGVHRALERAKWGAAHYPYVLKCDVRKYFASIDHEILNNLLARVIKCRRTLDLAAKIIAGSNRQEEATAYFRGDDLFAPFERRRGLPLGNQTSQFFANVYLNPLDQFVNRELRAASYVRYVDDLVLFGECKHELGRMKRRIEEFLTGLRVRIHPGKSRVYRCTDGVTFLGWRIFPDRTRLDRRNVNRFRRRMAQMADDFSKGITGWKQIQPRVQAWIGHARHGDTWNLRQQVFDQFAFLKGSTV